MTRIVNLKAAGIEDPKIYAVSCHKNVQSLNAYDRPTENDRKILANAVDKGSIQPKPSNSMKSPATCVDASVLKASSSTADVSLLQAAGFTWNNVTVNIVQAPNQASKQDESKAEKEAEEVRE